MQSLDFPHGLELLNDPALNKSTAFTEAESRRSES